VCNEVSIMFMLITRAGACTITLSHAHTNMHACTHACTQIHIHTHKQTTFKHYYNIHTIAPPPSHAHAHTHTNTHTPGRAVVVRSMSLRKAEPDQEHAAARSHFAAAAAAAVIQQGMESFPEE